MRLLTTTALGALLLAGCGGADTAAEAETPRAGAAVQDAEPLTPAEVEEDTDGSGDADPLAELPAGEYVLEKTHAYLTFSYSHGGYSNPILSFQEFDATATVNPDDPEASSLRVTIDPASIDSAVEAFDEHLTGPDMFDVETYPEITFASTGLTMDGPDTGQLTGELTMKGVTKPLTLDVTLNAAGVNRSGNPAFGISATGTLDRSEWDLGYAAPMVGTEVDLRIEAELEMASEG